MNEMGNKVNRTRKYRGLYNSDFIWKGAKYIDKDQGVRRVD